ncbi:MAG: hypothetical protein ACD_64C00252G0003, partial [uncultured bacterium]
HENEYTSKVVKKGEWRILIVPL